MELPADLAAPLQKLTQNEEFTKNIGAITRQILCVLLNIPHESEASCPSGFIFCLNYVIVNNLGLDSLQMYLPEQCRKDYLKACSPFQKIIEGQRTVDEPALTILKDMKSIANARTFINIENAREYWQIEVDDSSGQTTKFRVQFQAMAMLVFKLGQLVHHIEQSTLDDIDPKKE